jgi:GT2 family glycosyltransferase
MIEVSCLVVTWNGWPVLRECLSSLQRELKGDTFEVIVIDNGSTDETATEVPRRFPNVRFVRQPHNLGFAKANNLGVRLAAGELVLLLNNDATLLPGAMSALVETAARFSEFHVFAPQMLCFDAPDTVDNRGIYIDRMGHCRQLDSGAPITDHRPRMEVFGASGGACLVRRSVVEAIGLFDEALDSYKEDSDFAYRARAAGYRCLYVPDARILHRGSFTGNRMASRKLYLIQRNMLVIRRRWLEFRPWTSRSWLGVAYEVFQALKNIPRGQAGIVLRAKWDALRFASPHDQWPSRLGRERIAQWVGVPGQPIDAGEARDAKR